MNFETFMWLYTRLSALAIYALIIFGLVGALIMGARNEMNFAEVMRWAFSPNVHHAHATDVSDLAPYQGRFWKLTAILLLFVTASHGVHGVIVILDDYFVKPAQRLWIRYINIVIFAAVLLMGVYVIWKA
jgi:succinate dehydrogenase hydrophobic anchor subunit